jgi:hypothetical protein
VLRLLRLVYKLKRFRVILRALAILSPVMLTYGVVMFVLYYVFAMIGMELWGVSCRARQLFFVFSSDEQLHRD